MKIRGNLHGLSIQPDSELEYEQDGLIHGVLILEGDVQYRANVPANGDPHPDDDNALVFHRKITKIKLGKIRATCSYIGIEKDPTDFIIECIPRLDREPIDTHSKFVSDIGGTLGSEKNKAVFDSETGEFICFPPDAPEHLGGTQSYLHPGVSIRRSYWTRKVPDERTMGKIVARPSDMILPADVKNMLVGPITYRLVGSLYQVSEEQLGSGEDGWNTIIYA